MSDPSPNPTPRFRLTSVLRRSPDAAFVLSANGRLRYANPAWERLTGKTLAKLRGTRVSAVRTSASPLWQSLAPPAEVWAGRPTTVRRAPPDADDGPPWWDVSFLPLAGPSRPLAVVGTVRVVGEPPARGEYREPARLAELRKRVANSFPFDLIAGRLMQQARYAAESSAPLWLVGGAGSGKTTLARVVHHNGPRRERAFVRLDAAALEPYLADGLLFGKCGLLHGRTVGTLYLARPGYWPHELQDRIARWFQADRRLRPRLICGSANGSAADHASGRLSESFYTELSPLELALPALRDRPDEWNTLCERLLSRCVGPGDGRHALAEGTLEALAAYDWPGNVRELAEVLSRMAAAANGGPVGPGHVPRYVRERHLIAGDPRPPAGREWTLDQLLESVERRLIAQAVQDCGGSLSAAAERLGIPRARLGRRLEALGVAPDGRSEGRCDTHN